MRVSEDKLPIWLFVTYGGGHVAMVVPVALRVQELGLARPIVLALTTAATVVRNAGLKSLGFKDFVVDGIDDQALARGEKLLPTLPSPPVDIDETIAYLGMSYVDLEAQLGVEGAAIAYAKNGRQEFYPLNTMKRVLSVLQPALVIATNAPRAERAAIDAARALCIPSVCLVDMFALDEIRWIGQAGFADKVCVLSDTVRNRFIAAGRHPDDVVVTGNPAFDRLFDEGFNAEAQKIRAFCMGSHYQKIVLFASSVEPSTHPWYPGRNGNVKIGLETAESLSKFAQENPTVAVLVKPHPSEAASFPFEFAAARVCDPLWSLPALLRACDVVVVIMSTIAVEASLLGKPVIRVFGSLFDDAAPFQELGFAVASVELSQLPSTLAKILCDPPLFAMPTVPQFALDRVIAVISSLADNRGN